MTIEDLKLEIKALQQKDTEDAINNGFNNKDEWLKYILNQGNDEIAKHVQDLAQRYNISDNVIAFYFDPTMLIRLSKVKNAKQAAITK